MRRLLFALTFFLVTLPSLAAEQKVMRLGTLNLDFPAEWQFQFSGQRGEGKGPEGESVIVTYRVLTGETAEVVAQHWNFIRSFAAEKMPLIAVSHNNTVLQPVESRQVSAGQIMFSSVSHSYPERREYFFLQYFLGSSRMFAYFTVEGFGDARHAAQNFENILASQRWDE